MFSYYARWISDFSEKVQPFVQSKLNSSFSFSNAAINSFETFKGDLVSACLTNVKGTLFVVKCNASEHTLAATFNQGAHMAVGHETGFCFETGLKTDFFVVLVLV